VWPAGNTPGGILLPKSPFSIGSQGDECWGYTRLPLHCDPSAGARMRGGPASSLPSASLKAVVGDPSFPTLVWNGGSQKRRGALVECEERPQGPSV